MSGLKQAWRCGHAGRTGWRIAFEYDAETIEALKTAIPHTQRLWDADNREWWIDGEYEDAILTLFPGFEAFLNQPRLL